VLVLVIYAVINGIPISVPYNSLSILLLSVSFCFTRQSEDELKKDSVRQEEETPIDDGRGPKVATRKKRKVPKLKLNRFRKKNKRPTDSATEELVSSPAEDE